MIPPESTGQLGSSSADGADEVPNRRRRGKRKKQNMKKLMMVAAVAAMAGGAFAEGELYNDSVLSYGNWQKANLGIDSVETNYWDSVGGTNLTVGIVVTNYVTTIALPTNSLLLVKSPKNSQKVFSLNCEDANKKFKAFKTGNVAKDFSGKTQVGFQKEALDGVYYYDTEGTNGWAYAMWHKTQGKEITPHFGRPYFSVFTDGAKNAYVTLWSANAANGETNAYTTCYAKLKVAKDGTIDQTIKSIKNLGSAKYSIKNYKDAAACKKALDKLLKKYDKAAEVK